MRAPLRWHAEVVGSTKPISAVMEAYFHLALLGAPRYAAA